MLPNRMLSHARALRGWSQGMLADKLGTSRKNVSRWECGETFPSPYYREQLCQLFELDAQELGLMPSSIGDDTIDTNTSTAIIEPLSALAPPPRFNDIQRFIGHEELSQDLLCQLLPGSSLALTGLPGIGKTALLGKLLQHPCIKERFPDGIIWVGLGPTPDLPRRLAWMAGLLGFSTIELEGEESETGRMQILSRFLYEAFIAHRLLIILDDVWTVEAALPFLIGSSSVAYVLTTRLPNVAFALASQPPYVVPPLSFEESNQLLTTFLPKIDAIDKTIQQRIVECTGGLPLAITLIGKYLALHSYGGQARRLEMALDKLADPGYRLRLSSPSLPVNVPHTQNNGAAHSLERAIALSDQQLPVIAQQALRALSVLPCAPEYFSDEAALAITDTGQEVLDQLVDIGLLEPIGMSCYRIHRVIADYGWYHLKEQTPQLRLVRYMEKVCVKHETNVSLLQREYRTLVAGFNTARALGMHDEMFQGVFTLIPLMRMHGEAAQADQYLRKALHAAIEQQNQILCQKILFHLASFAQLRRDETQSTAYQSLSQALSDRQIGQKPNNLLLTKIRKTVKEQIDTPRFYAPPDLSNGGI